MAAQKIFKEMLRYFRLVTDRKLNPDIMRRQIDFIQHETRSDYTVVVVDSLHKLPFQDLSDRRTGIDSWLRHMESIRDEQNVSFFVVSELSRGEGGSYSERPDLGSFKESGDIVKKACGYISIGLDRMIEKEGGISSKLRDNHCALFLKKHPLSSIFRVGYGLALKLKWRAEKWLDKCWFAKMGLPLTFWGEEWTGVLGGILIKKPLFYDNYKSGLLYREFVSINDIKETETQLDKIIAFDNLLSLMTINLKPLSSYRFLSHKNLILTLWARRHLKLPEEPDPLAVDKFKRFYALLFSDKGKQQKIGQPMKESFLKWLAERTKTSDFELSKNLGETFEKLFSEIEIEYGQVSSEDLDPRYIHLFLVEK